MTDHCRGQWAEQPSPGVSLVAGVVSVGVLAVALGLMILGVSWFWVAFPVGYGGLLPVAVGWANRRAERTTGETDSEESPVMAVKLAYARGEIDEVELERRLETLLGDGEPIDPGAA